MAYICDMKRNTMTKSRTDALATIKAFDENNKKARPRFYVDVKLSRLLGILPYSEELGYSKRWASYSIALFIVIMISEFFRMSQFLSSKDKDYIRLALENGVKLLRLAVIVAHLRAVFKDRRRFLRILRALTDPAGGEVIGGRFSFFSFLGAALYYVTHYAKNCIKSAVPQSFRCLNDFTNLLILRQFCNILDISRKQMSDINKQMMSPCCSVRVMSDLCETHLQHLESALKANEFYSFQILLMCLYIFIKILHLLFEVTAVKLEGPVISKIILHQGGATAYAVFLLLILTVLAHCCEKVKEEVKRFNSNLYKLVLERPSFRDNEKLRLYLEVHPTVEFTANDFFPVGFPLVTSTIAAASTYTILIAQFNDAG